MAAGAEVSFTLAREQDPLRAHVHFKMHFCLSGRKSALAGPDRPRIMGCS